MESLENGKINAPSLWPELKRKAFHLLALGYVVALVRLPRPDFIRAIAVLFLAVAAIEFLRLKIPSFNGWIIARFGTLFREEEKTHFTGIFWMILGVEATALMIEPLPLAVTALLYLILGDGVASLVGKRLGGPHWPGSQKRITGSAACFLVCVIIGQTLLYPLHGWHGIFIGALTATVVEFGILRLNDNFTIPFFSSAALLASYGLQPYFLNMIRP